MTITRQQRRVKRPMAEWQAAIVLGGVVLASVQRYLHLHTDALAACVSALES